MIIPAKIEFVDNFVIRRIEEMMPMGLPVDAQLLLLLQVDGSVEAVEADAKQILDTFKRSGARVARLAKDEAEAAMFWKFVWSAAFIFYTERTLNLRTTGVRPVFGPRACILSA